jgi:isopentenyl-diphosphate delta-isomerase
MQCGELEPGGVYRYRAELADLVENELDHLLLTTVSGEPDPNPDEVVEWRFIAVDELARWLDERPSDFTAWFPPAWSVLER